MRVDRGSQDMVCARAGIASTQVALCRTWWGGLAGKISCADDIEEEQENREQWESCLGSMNIHMHVGRVFSWPAWGDRRADPRVDTGELGRICAGWKCVAAGKYHTFILLVRQF